MTQTSISYFIEMANCIENPKNLKKYEKLKFWSEVEFEQYLLDKFKFI